MTKKKSKAALVKDLHKKGLPVDDGMTVDQMQFRLDNWRSQYGWIVRQFRPHPDENHPSNLLEPGELTWVPDSDFGEEICTSGKVMIIRQVPYDGTIPLLTIPKDYQSGGIIVPDEEE